MSTFESAISRAETDLAHVESALDTAQHVLEIADRAHRNGRRLVKVMRRILVASVLGGLAVGTIVLFIRVSRQQGRHQKTEWTEASSASSGEPRALVDAPNESTHE